VRELENAIVRGVNFCRSNLIEAKDLGIPSDRESLMDEPVTVVPAEVCSFKSMKQRTIESFEKDYIVRLMHEHHGNVSQAAQAAGKERREIGKMLKKYRINPKLFHAFLKA
jgi:DNA-binding NtrC family response regulator